MRASVSFIETPGRGKFAYNPTDIMHRPLHIARLLKRALRRVAALAIAVQLLMPSGYMPGRFADGTPFVLCHMYTAALDFRALPPHVTGDDTAHDHGHARSAPSDHDEHSGGDAWENCPLGALSSLPVMATVLAPAVIAFDPDSISTQTATLRPTAATVRPRARAPPTA
jgi:hypothetical protein